MQVTDYLDLEMKIRDVPIEDLTSKKLARDKRRAEQEAENKKESENKTKDSDHENENDNDNDYRRESQRDLLNDNDDGM